MTTGQKVHYGLSTIEEIYGEDVAKAVHGMSPYERERYINIMVAKQHNARKKTEAKKEEAKKEEAKKEEAKKEEKK